MPSSNWTKNLIVNRHFRIDWRAHAVVLILAISVSFIIYTLLMARFQRVVSLEYENATVICNILRQSTLNHPGRCGVENGGKQTISRSALVDLLLVAEVIDHDEAAALLKKDEAETDRSPAEFIIAELERYTAGLETNIQASGGLDWAIHLVQSIGKQSGVDDAVPEKILELNRAWMGVSLANIDLSRFDRAVDAYEKAIEDGNIAFDPEMISGVVFFPAEIVDDTDVISLLYKSLGVTGGAVEENDAKEQRFIAVDKLVKFIVAQSHGDRDVKKAKRKLTILRGPEQLLIMILTTYLLMVLLLRVYLLQMDRRSMANLREAISTYAKNSLEEIATGNDRAKLESYRAELRSKLQDLISRLNPRKSLIAYISAVINNKLMPHDREVEIATMRGVGQSEIDQLYLSRWAIRWSTRIIPAIGFIGTVRGILYALPGTDNIVWAATRAERASAIGVVATDLGLAFATTFMALVVGVVLSWLNDQEMTAEEKYVVKLSEFGSTAVDPRLGVH